MFQRVTLLDTIDFVTASDSELSHLSNDESDENHILSRQVDQINQQICLHSKGEDDIPLANIAESNNAPSTSTLGNPAK